MRNVTKGLFLTLIVSIALSSIAVASLKDGLLGYWNLDEADGKNCRGFKRKRERCNA